MAKTTLLKSLHLHPWQDMTYGGVWSFLFMYLLVFPEAYV